MCIRDWYHPGDKKSVCFTKRRKGGETKSVGTKSMLFEKVRKSERSISIWDGDRNGERETDCVK